MRNKELVSVGNRLSYEMDYYAEMIDADHFVVKMKDKDMTVQLAIYSIDELAAMTMEYLLVNITINDKTLLITLGNT